MGATQMTTKYEYDEDEEVIGMTGHVPVKLMDGKYKGVTVEYGHIKFEEVVEGGMKCDFRFNVIECPDTFTKENLTEHNTEFVNVLGDILLDVLSKEIEEVGDDFLRGEGTA